MRSFQKNAKNTHFETFWAKRPILDHFWPKGAIFEFSLKKRKRHSFFSFFNTKNQKTLMRGFSGKWAHTNVRTYERTEVNPKVHRLLRETKNLIKCTVSRAIY